jgi:hypothetical protein
LQDVGANGPDDTVPGIALGDWVDLPSLAVEAYSGIADAVISITANTAIDSGDPAKGALLRLIVAGNNSFHSGKGVGGQYDKTDNDDTPHLVFQFQNVPGAATMESSIYAGGYKASGMRKYLTPTGDEGSGKFLAGLVSAGVPEDWLFAPTRYVTNNGKWYHMINGTNISRTDDRATAADEVQDLVWLPTERELFGGNTHSNGAYETAANQARLEYYAGDAARIKYASGGSASGYWEASPGPAYGSTTQSPGANSSFCKLSSQGAVSYALPNEEHGVAPAFCVK